MSELYSGNRDLLLFLVLLPTAWPVSSAEPKLFQDNLKSHHIPKPPSQQLLEASPAPQPHGLFQVHGPFSATSAYKPFTSRTRSSYTWQVYACIHVKSLELHPSLCDPMDCSPPGGSVHGVSPGKNTGVGCHALLQGIFPTQGSSPHLPWLLYCRWILLPPSPWQVYILICQWPLCPGSSHDFATRKMFPWLPFLTRLLQRTVPSFPRKESEAPGDQSPGYHLISSGPGRPPTPRTTHTRQPPAQLCRPGQRWDWALTPWSLQETSQQQNQDKMFSCVLKTNLQSHPTDSVPPPKPSLTIIQLMGRKREIHLFCIKGGGKFIALQNFETKKKKLGRLKNCQVYLEVHLEHGCTGVHVYLCTCPGVGPHNTYEQKIFTIHNHC